MIKPNAHRNYKLLYSCTKSFYDIKNGFNPNLSAMRTTNFGIGERSSLVNSELGPEPASYKLSSSLFLQNKIKRKGHSFGDEAKICFPYE